MTLMKNLNGEHVEMSPEEEAATRAEWAANEAAAAAIVPAILPWWKGRAIIEARGLTAGVQAAINGIADAGQRKIVQAAYDGADFARSSPTLIATLHALNQSDADIDALFVDGDKITL